MKLKQILISGCVIVLFSCSKKDIAEPFDPAKLAGTTYSTSTRTNIIQFISNDSLIYTNTLYPEFDIKLKLKYTIEGEKLEFSGADTIRTDYKDPILNTEHFMVYYYQESFRGYFKNAEILEASQMLHGWNSYEDDEYPTGTNSITTRGVIFNRENK